MANLSFSRAREALRQLPRSQYDGWRHSFHWPSDSMAGALQKALDIQMELYADVHPSEFGKDGWALVEKQRRLIEEATQIEAQLQAIGDNDGFPYGDREW